MRHSRSRRARAVPSPIVVLVTLVALALAACGGAATATPSGPSPTGSLAPAVTATPVPAATPATAFPLTVVDDEGTEVTIPARPERIVSLTPATTEILFAVGAGPRVVATTDFDDYPPEAISLPDVATYQGVDVEKIVGLEADLVVAGGNSFNDPEALARLRTLGIPVLAVYAPDVAAVLRDVELVATAAGEPEAGATLAGTIRTELDAIAAAVAADGATRPRVFYELDATKEIYGPAADSFIAEMITLAGGDPITTGSPTVFSIPLETLIAADPEVIVLGDAAYGVTEEQVAQRPGWSAMTAVADGAIRPVDDVVVTRPGPRLAEGLRALALAIDPEVVLPAPIARAGA